MSTHGDRIRAHVEIDSDASAVTASWRRCLNIYRLDPERAEPPQPDPGALREARARALVLRRVAEACLDQLFALLADTDCAVFLSDKSGLALDIRTNRKRDGRLRTGRARPMPRPRSAPTVSAHVSPSSEASSSAARSISWRA